MIVKLLIPDEFKAKHFSFDECRDSDGYYNIQVLNYITLEICNVRVPRRIVKRCWLQKSIFEIDDSDIHLIEHVDD
jgi:hypothetical protein